MSPEELSTVRCHTCKGALIFKRIGANEIETYHTCNQATLQALQRERELSDQLAAALKHVKWVLQKHHDSAVLIRNGDIELATIKPHCAIRKGSAAYRFATAALAQYAAMRRGPENDKGCEGQASTGEPTKGNYHFDSLRFLYKNYDLIA